MTRIFSTSQGHSFSHSTLQPVIIYTSQDIDYIYPGSTVKDQDGNEYIIAARDSLKHGNLNIVTLVPLS